MALEQGEAYRDAQKLRVNMQRNYRERNREKENLKVYDSTYFGQWHDASVRMAMQEGRSLSTFNLIKKSIDTTVGSIMADPYELRYDTELGDENIYAEVLNELYLEDKDFMGYETAYWEFLRSGFVFRGYLQIYKDRTKDRRGRVGMRYIRGDYFITDPDVMTNDINDNKDIFVGVWMSPVQIQEKFDKKNAEIQDAIKEWKAYSQSNQVIEETTSESDEHIWDHSPEFYDSKYGLYLVVDRYWLVKKKYYEVFDVASASVMATVPPEQAEILKQSYEMEGRIVKLLPKYVKECRQRTTCPGISTKMVLQEGAYEYQLGRYPFFWFSSDMLNGKPITFVDILKDSQTQLNKRHNTATHILQTSTNNALLIESDAVDDDDQIEEIGKRRNRPGAYFKVTPGTVQGQKIKHLEHGNLPNDFLNAASHILNLMRELTPAVPALQGIGEKEESGVLFQSKVQQALIGMQIPSRKVNSFWEEFGNAYLMAAKQTYTYPILLRSSRTGKEYWLNIPGDPNSIKVSGIPRLKVNISQSPSSETHRRQLLQSYLAIAQYLRDPYTLSELSRIVVGSLPGIPQAEQEQLKASAQLSSEAQKVALEFQVAQMQGQLQQIQGGGIQPPGGGEMGIGSSPPIGQNMPGNAPTDSQNMLQQITDNVQNRKNSVNQGLG